LTKNGHVVAAGEGDIRIVADVEDFWLEAIGGGGPTQYVGRVALALAVRDERTGATLFTRRYAGIRRQSGAPDARETWREVMDTALARMLRDIATDAGFVAAVGGRTTSTRPRRHAGSNESS
jgi:hypothetical protein